MEKILDQIHPDPILVEKAHCIHRILLEQYGEPIWHAPHSPLDELVSTILSQNTNDRNRDAAYRKLRTKFPSWEAVRDGDAGEVVETIRTAGLANQKGPRIQAILKKITAERGSLDLAFLSHQSADMTREWLLGLNGVGPKTAAIVMQFTLDMPAFPVDTHIYRVSGRLGLRPQNMNVEKTHLFLSA